MIKYFRGVWKDRYVLSALVKQDLQSKYRRSVLGVAWSVLTPFGLVVIMGLVYSIIFNTDIKTFIPLLFTGLNPWLFMSGAAEGGCFAFIVAEGYLKQTTVNAQIFPLRISLVAFINMLYGLAAFLIVYLFLQPTMFGPNMLMVLPGLIIIFLFATALANFSAVINLLVRDYQPFQTLLFQGLFYATPIVFPVEMLQEKGFGIIYKINPFYYLLEVVRQPLLGKAPPPLKTYFIAVSITLVLFVVSSLIIMKIKKNITFRL